MSWVPCSSAVLSFPVKGCSTCRACCCTVEKRRNCHLTFLFITTWCPPWYRQLKVTGPSSVSSQPGGFVVCCVGGLFCCVRAHGRIFLSVTSVRSCKEQWGQLSGGAGWNVSCVDIWEEAHFSLSGIVSAGIEGLLLVWSHHLVKGEVGWWDGSVNLQRAEMRFTP